MSHNQCCGSYFESVACKLPITPQWKKLNYSKTTPRSKVIGLQLLQKFRLCKE